MTPASGGGGRPLRGPRGEHAPVRCHRHGRPGRHRRDDGPQVRDEREERREKSENEGERLWAHQLQLTIADLVQAIQHTHHPVAHGLYYDDQKSEALTYTRHFLAERVPKFLGYFERVLGTRGFMVGTSVTYVDLSIYYLFEGLRFSFPKAMQRLEPQYPGLVALRDRVAARPRIVAYRESKRCMAFNDRGVFRYYPELDAS